MPKQQKNIKEKKQGESSKKIGFTRTPFSEKEHTRQNTNGAVQHGQEASARRSGEKVRGFTCGAFDLCHAGHMLVFKEAKTVCDRLIVFLQEDPSVDDPSYRGKLKNKPVMSLEERTIILEGIKYIDEIIPYTTETDLYEKLKRLKAHVRIIGLDWKGKQFTGHDLPFDVYYNSRDHHFSTSALRERVHKAELQKRKEKQSIPASK